MAFVSLGKRRFSRADTDAFRIAVEAKTVVFKPPGSVLAELGWTPDGTKVDLQEGSGDDAGFLRIAADPNGWKLQRAGGKGSTGYVIKASRGLFQGPPEPMKTTLVDQYQIIGGALVVRAPWKTPKPNSITTAAQEPAARSMSAAGGNGHALDMEAHGLATSEKVEARGKDCNAPAPSSEGGHIPGTAGSLVPCAIPEPEAKPLPVQPRSLADVEPPNPVPGGAGGADVPSTEAAAGLPEPARPPAAFGRMSAAQTEEFVQAAARGAKRAELEEIVTKLPARYGSGTVPYLKEELASRIAAAVKAPPATGATPAPEPLKRGALPDRPQAAIPPLKTGPPPLQPRPVASNGSAAASDNPPGRPHPDRSAPPPPIGDAVLKFLREEVVPVLALFGKKMTKTPDGTGLLMDGRPVTLDRVVEEANRILQSLGDDMIVAPATAARTGK